MFVRIIRCLPYSSELSSLYNFQIILLSCHSHYYHDIFFFCSCVLNCFACLLVTLILSAKPINSPQCLCSVKFLENMNKHEFILFLFHFYFLVFFCRCFRSFVKNYVEAGTTKYKTRHQQSFILVSFRSSNRR